MNLENRNTISFLHSYWGESNKAITISNRYELISNFGLPQSENYQQWYNAYNYLKYQDSIDIVRPLSILVENKKLDFTENLVPVADSVGTFYNTEVADLDTIEQGSSEGFTVIEKYCNSTESLAVVICSSATTWKNPITDEYVDIVISKSITDPSAIIAPDDGDTYIVGVGGIGVWFGEDGKLAVWDDDNTLWTFVSTTEGSSYYITTETSEFYKDGSTFVERDTTLDYIDHDDHTYIRQTYTSIQDSDGVVKNCNQLMTTSPNFSNDEFAIFVFKLNSLDLYDLVERYTCSTDSTSIIYYDDVINGTSNYIYLKHFEGVYDNTGFSLMSNMLVFDDAPVDFLNVLPANYKTIIDTIDFNDYNIVINCEIDSSQAYIPTACIDTTCLCITTAWSEYDTTTDLINDFGIYSDASTGYTIFDKNNLIIGNWKKQTDTYNDTKRVQSFGGDVAGYILDDVKQPDWDNCQELIMFGFEDIVSLRENKINLALNYNDYKNFFTTEQYIPKFKYGYNVLIHHKIEKAVGEIINNSDNRYKPPFERYKDRIQVPINNYLNGLIGIDIDNYTLSITLDDENVITITISVSYYMLIENIIVNFTATIGNLSETMYMYYKDK